jgi:CoA-dependent NAD(P)H sulfur oxidoreductase
MMKQHLVVIGGVAGGLSAATWARRQNAQLKITVLEKGSAIAYAACGLPYVISGEIAGFAPLQRYAVADFQRREIDIGVQQLVEQIEVGPQCLRVRDLAQHRSYQLNYDWLLIATGARPRRPPVTGGNLPGVFTLRHLTEAEAISRYLQSARPRRAVVVGAGYLGLEMADALAKAGLAVVVLETTDRALGSFDGRLATQLQQQLANYNINLVYGQSVIGLEGQIQVEYVVTADRTWPADLVIWATGVEPVVDLARTAGIRLGATGAIAVADTQQTSVPSVFATGDCAEVPHLVTEQPAYVPLGTTANKQGRVAGINLGGGVARFRGVVGTQVAKVAGLEVATTGLSLLKATQAGFLPQVVETDSPSRANYYPGATRITTRLVYDHRTGRLLGAQMLGAEGVAQRIDVLATALYARLRVEDLLNLDLAYAPPFAPVWDPLLYAARKVSN